MKNHRSSVIDNDRSTQKLDATIEKGKEFKFQTRNTLPEKVRAQIDVLLQDRLADSIDLVVQLKQAHWNVKGPAFIGLHKLFDEVWKESLEYSDLIAERIVQLGGVAEGTIHVAGTRSSLPDYPLILTSGKEHVAALSHTLATYGEYIRQSVKQADELGDVATVDIFTEILRGADKNLWFIEAQAQSDS